MNYSHEDSHTVIVTYDNETGKPLSEEWKNADGQRHRRNGPAVTTYFHEKNSRREDRYIDGKECDVDGPFRRRIDMNTGICTFESWVGEHRRLADLPQAIYRDANTVRVTREEWRDEDYLLWRPSGGPALLEYDPNTGALILAEWWEKEKLHRNNGKPAVLKFDPLTGANTSEEFWENGQQISKPFRKPNALKL